MIDRVLGTDHPDILEATDPDLVVREEGLDLIEGAREVVDELLELIGPANGEICHHPPDTRRRGSDPRAGIVLEQLVDIFALMEGGEEDCGGYDINSGRREVEVEDGDAVSQH